MATGKKSFIAYADWKLTFDELPNEDAGKLIKHIFAYVNDEDPETDSILIKAVFANIKTTLKRDLEKWDGQRQQRVEAGIKSAEIRKRNATLVNGRSVSSTVSVNVNDIKESKPHLSDEAIDFNSLLDAYNKLTGKKAKVVNDKTKKQIKTRFKEGYTKDDLWDAMVNCSKDPFHIENGYKHFTLEFITRADKLDKFSTAKPIKQKTNDYGKL